MADSLASQIITAIGGPENVRSLTHCATRLRFELADASKVDQNALEHMKGVLGAVPQSGDRFQVVIGGGVATVYENIMHLPEMANAGAASASGEGQKSNADVKAEARSKARGKVAWLDSFFEYLADSFRPILGVLLGASIIIALVNLLISLNVIPNDEASAGWVFVKAIWKGVFYFLPIMVAYNASKKLKVDPWLGGAIMAILMTPQFTSLIDAKTTTCVENAALGTKSCTANIFGIPMALSDYSGNVFVPLLMAAVLALVYHGLKKIIPESVQLVFVPFFCMIIVGALTSDNFFSMDNILNVLRRITVNGMLAVACTMTLLVGGFDLSIGHVMALSAVLCIGFEKSTGSGAVGIVVALAAGLVLGLVNGLLMKLTRGGSGEGFMITLATGMMAQALAKWYCAGSEIIRIDLPAEIDWFKQLGQGNLLGFPICTLIWITVMVILQIVIKKTTFGRQMLLTGANKKSAFLAGINVNRVKVIAYTVAGFCCGIAAVIYAARFTSASDGAGVGGDFNGAVCSIIGGNAGMVQVFIGTVTFGLISNILQLFGLSTAVQYIVQGAILLLAINLDNLKKR